MKFSFKNELKDAFEAPQPLDKERFLKNFYYEKPVSNLSFIKSQIGYISLRFWIITMFSFGLILKYVISMGQVSVNNLITSSSILPLIVIIGIPEIMKSVSYNMIELEKSCKYRLNRILLSRLTIVGFIEFILLFIVIAVISFRCDFDIAKVISMMTVPFLININITLLILNYLNSKDTIYICASVSVFLCFMNSQFAGKLFLILLSDIPLIVDALIVFLICMMISKAMKLIKKQEVLEWGLKSIN